MQIVVWSSISQNSLLFSSLSLNLETDLGVRVVDDLLMNLSFYTNKSSTKYPNTHTWISLIFLGMSVCFLSKDLHNWVWNLIALSYCIDTVSSFETLFGKNYKRLKQNVKCQLRRSLYYHSVIYGQHRWWSAYYWIVACLGIDWFQVALWHYSYDHGGLFWVKTP